MRVVADSFKNYTINSLTKKKIETNFIMSRALFQVAQINKKKKNYFLQDFVEMAIFLA